MGNILLFLVAVVLLLVIGTVGFVFQLFSILLQKQRFKALQRYFLLIAVSIDQLGNVLCSGLLNATLRTNNGHYFGNEDETISSVLGKNQKAETLTKTGKVLASILDKIDPNHCLKSIERDEISPNKINFKI